MSGSDQIDTYSQEDIRQDESLLIVACLLITSVIIPIAIFSNLLVIVAIAKFERLHQPSSYLLLSLAFSDIAVSILAPLLLFGESYPDLFFTSFGAPACLIPTLLMVAALSMCHLCLAAVAYERYRVIVLHLHHSSLSTPVCLLLILSLFLLSLITSMAPLMGGWYDPDIPSSSCTYSLVDGWITIVHFVAIFIPSNLIILSSYWRMGSIARHHQRAVAQIIKSVQYNHSGQGTNNGGQQGTSSRTLGLAFSLFPLLWLPVAILYLYHASTGVHLLTRWYRNIFAVIPLINMTLNPWLYAYRQPEFAQAFRRLGRRLKNCICCIDELDDDEVIFDVNEQGHIFEDHESMANNHLSFISQHFAEVHATKTHVNQISNEKGNGSNNSSANNPVMPTYDMTNSLAHETETRVRHGLTVSDAERFVETLPNEVIAKESVVGVRVQSENNNSVTADKASLTVASFPQQNFTVTKDGPPSQVETLVKRGELGGSNASVRSSSAPHGKFTASDHSGQVRMASASGSRRAVYSHQAPRPTDRKVS